MAASAFEVYEPGGGQLLYVVLTRSPLREVSLGAGGTLLRRSVSPPTKKDPRLETVAGSLRSLPPAVVEALEGMREGTLLQVSGSLEEAFARARAALETILATVDEAWVFDALAKRLHSRESTLALPAAPRPIEPHLGSVAETNVVVSRGLLKLGRAEIAIPCEEARLRPAAENLIVEIARAVLDGGVSFAGPTLLELTSRARVVFHPARVDYTHEARSWPDTAAIAQHGPHMMDVSALLVPRPSPKQKTLLMATVRDAEGKDVTRTHRSETLAPSRMEAAVSATTPDAKAPRDPAAVARRLSALIRAGTRFEGERRFEVVHRPLGSLRLPSGRLVVTDPLHEPDDEALAVSLPPGEHRLVLAVARFAEDEELPALALLELGASEARSFERGGEHAVGSETTAYMDANAARALVRRRDEDWRAAVDESLDYGIRTGDPERRWLHGVVEIPAVGRAPATNIIAFTSGRGNGTYGTFVGRDERGAIVAVVTYFGLDELVIA